VHGSAICTEFGGKRRAITAFANRRGCWDYCAGRGIAPEIERMPIQKNHEAYERIVKSPVKFRFVIDRSTV
jgi:D-arabinose 1-dehydrogenase-like Zn-dependent alcohol dehydrogenase